MTASTACLKFEGLENKQTMNPISISACTAANARYCGKGKPEQISPETEVERRRERQQRRRRRKHEKKSKKKRQRLQERRRRRKEMQQLKRRFMGMGRNRGK